MSAIGTLRTFVAAQRFVRYWSNSGHSQATFMSNVPYGDDLDPDR